MNRAASRIHRWRIHDPEDDRLNEDNTRFLEEEWMTIYDRPIVKNMLIYISSNTYISKKAIYRIAKIHSPNITEEIYNTFLGGQFIQGLLSHLLHPADYNLLMKFLSNAEDWRAQIYEWESEARLDNHELHDNENRMWELEIDYLNQIILRPT